MRKVKCEVGKKEIELIASPVIAKNQQNIPYKIPKLGESNKKIKKEFLKS